MKRYALLLLLSSALNAHVIDFDSDVCLELSSETKYKTCDDLRVVLDDKYVIIPEDFEVDLNTIPQLLRRWINPPDPETLLALLLHEYLYTGVLPYSRYESDVIFYETMRTYNISRTKSYLMYKSFRMFNSRNWKGYNYDNGEEPTGIA